MNRSRVLCLVTILATTACAKEKTSPIAQEEPAKEELADNQPAKEELADNQLPAAPTAAPEFSAATVSAKAAQRSRKLNQEALALHRDKKFSESAILFIQALESNPGNLLARYNLACTYNLAGKRELALQRLGELRQDNCRACYAQLLGAANDKDWASALDDKEFLRIVNGLAVDSPTMKELATTVRKAFDKNDPTRATKFLYTMGNCNPDEGEPCSTVEKAYGAAEFGANMKALTSITSGDDSDVGFRNPDGIDSCKAQCCEYKMHHVSHGTLWLSKVCFHDKAGVLFLSSIEATDES